MARVLILILFITSLSAKNLQVGVAVPLYEKRALAYNDSKYDDQMWYWLNLARLNQIDGKYKESIYAYERAYVILNEYENRAKISLRNIGSSIGSALISKGFDGYYGSGYERSLMHTLNALNYMMIGDFEGAAVEMRRMELRQDFWLEESSSKILKASEKASKNSNGEVDISKVPNDYSMANILKDDSVRAVANNYQDPFSYALSSLIYTIAYDSEELIDINLRRSVALNPLSKEIFKPSSGEKSVTVVAIGGFAPALTIERVRFPLFRAQTYTSLELPSLYPPKDSITSIKISTKNTTITPPKLLQSHLLAYKTLQDEYLSNLFESLARATTKGVIAKQAQDSFGDLGGLLASVIMDIFSSSNDKSYRNWDLLPNSGYLTQFKVKKGDDIAIEVNKEHYDFTIDSDVFILVDFMSQQNKRIDYVKY